MQGSNVKDVKVGQRVGIGAQSAVSFVKFTMSCPSPHKVLTPYDAIFKVMHGVQVLPKRQ